MDRQIIRFRRNATRWTLALGMTFLLGLVAALLLLPTSGVAVEADINTAAAGAAALPLRHMENLGRGVVAIHEGKGKVYVGWRLLGTDPDDIAFNLYRTTGNAEPKKLNDQPITQSTNFVDTGVDTSQPISYFVKPITGGTEQTASDPFKLQLQPDDRPCLSIPIQTIDGYRANDASAGDLDGDGEYEIVLHQAGRGRDNGSGGTTTEPILEAYKLDGTRLWQINLGKNIREGAHYTQFLVYDFDGDGKAEVACKTADGTIDGAGKVIGDAKADHVNDRGYILDGPEFLTVFEGLTGKALATVDYIPPRGDVSAWGDSNGNRVDRFLACVAYLDGQRPSLVMCRGYYTRAVLAAWNWRDGKLTHLWTFDSDDGTPGNRAYRGQGNHNLTVTDVDGDGKDEIIYGASCIDDNGKGLYSTGLGHGDAIHVSDLDPDRPGLEIFDIHENPRHNAGAEIHDARTGEIIWAKPGGDERAPDVGRGIALDIDPRHRGAESWSAALRGLWNAKGDVISNDKPESCNMGIWWDDDPLRELLNGVRVEKWDYQTGQEKQLLSGFQHGAASNNGTKMNPCLCADILGDWREELITRSRDGKSLLVFVSTIPSERRMYTLMHDPQYRLSIAWQNVAYNQPAHTSFHFGEGMQPPPRPRITTK